MTFHLGLGNSLSPFIPSESLVEVEAISDADIRPGDLILYCAHQRTICHRVLKIRKEGSLLWFFVKGDHNLTPDGWVPSYRLTGRVTHVNGESLSSHLWKRRARTARLRSLAQSCLYSLCFESRMGQALGTLRRRWFHQPIFSPTLFSLLHTLTPRSLDEAA